MYRYSDLHDYQKTAIAHQISNNDSMLWLDMGLGKTVITLSTINHRIKLGLVKKVLIFGPLRVIHSVWEKEAKKWDYLKHIRFQVIHGSESKREQRLFNEYADIYLINYENMAWLAGLLYRYYVSQHKNLPFQMVVYDEITKVKKSGTVRMAGCTKITNEGKKNEFEIKVIGWRKVLNSFKYRTGLTGTPSPNGYVDLHGQYLAVDGGKRLCEFVTDFRYNFLTKNYNGFGNRVTEYGIQLIENRIKDITLTMNACDYINMPDTVINDVYVEFTSKIRQQYDELERSFFVDLDSQNNIEVFNQASLSNKCLQFCNGSPFLDPQKPDWYCLHDLKLKALEDILEEAGGNPVLVAYTFKPDAIRIMEKFKNYNPVNLTKTKAEDLSTVIQSIAAENHRLIVGHPASMSHGIDGLQYICNIGVWFGLNWNLEYYLQFIARLARQGQKNIVTIHRIICRNSIDEIVAESLTGKSDDQSNLRQAIQRYRDRQDYDFW